MRELALEVRLQRDSPALHMPRPILELRPHQELDSALVSRTTHSQSAALSQRHERLAGRSTGNASGSLFSQSSHDKLAPMLLPVVKTLIECVTKCQALRLSSGANLRTQVVTSILRYSRQLNRLRTITYRLLGPYIPPKKAYACLKLCPYPAIILINK